MPKLKRTLRLTRASDAFIPLAFAICSLLLDPSVSLRLFAACLAVSALSLFSCFGVRAAFAIQPSMRSVRGTVKFALLLQIAGGLVAALICVLSLKEDPDTIPLIASGFLINIEHTFYEYLYAAGDRRSATLCHGIAATFLVAGMGLSMGPENNCNCWRITTMLEIAALVSLIIGCAMGDGLKGRINAQVLRCAPRAALQCALYPAVATLILWAMKSDACAFPFFAGLTLCALCRTPFRRSRLESVSLNRALLIALIVAAAVWAATTFIPALTSTVDAANPLSPLQAQLPTTCILVAAAAVCSFALYGNIKKIDDE